MSEPVSLIGVCGDDCSVCPRRKATLDDDTEALARLKELWVAFGWRAPGVDPETLRCTGCRAENPCAYREARDCAFGRGIANCGVCSEYPCNTLDRVFAKSDVTRDALLRPGICTPGEWDEIDRAYFRKRENLERVKDPDKKV